MGNRRIATREEFARIVRRGSKAAKEEVHFRGSTDGTASDPVTIARDSFRNPMTTYGDLIRGGEGGAPVRVAAPGSAGLVLTSVSDGAGHFIEEWDAAPTTYTDEMARDAIGLALTEGAGIDITVNDPADTITIASTITQYTDEMARDAIGAALVGGTNIGITVDDPGDTITIDFTGTASGQYRYMLVTDDGSGGWGFVQATVGGVTRPVMALADLE